MASPGEYPTNWTEIATAVKRSSGYHCNRCNLKCLPPTDSYRHLNLSLRRNDKLRWRSRSIAKIALE